MGQIVPPKSLKLSGNQTLNPNHLPRKRQPQRPHLQDAPAQDAAPWRRPQRLWSYLVKGLQDLGCTRFSSGFMGLRVYRVKGGNLQMANAIT